MLKPILKKAFKSAAETLDKANDLIEKTDTQSTDAPATINKTMQDLHEISQTLKQIVTDVEAIMASHRNGEQSLWEIIRNKKEKPKEEESDGTGEGRHSKRKKSLFPWTSSQ